MPMQAGTLTKPTTLEELNLKRDLVSSLVLRTLAFSDRMSGAALENRLGLPFETIKPLIQGFDKPHLTTSPGVSTEPGRDGMAIDGRTADECSPAGRQHASALPPG